MKYDTLIVRQYLEFLDVLHKKVHYGRCRYRMFIFRTIFQKMKTK